METFECYCIYQRYEWVVIDVSRNDTLRLLCPQNEVNLDKFQINITISYILQKFDSEKL